MCGPDSSASALSFQQAFTSSVHSGLTCMAMQFSADRADWSAVRFSDPVGYDLAGAAICSFWAKGEHGGEAVRFEVGGEPGDSLRREIYATLTAEWQWYTIDLVGANLRSVKGLFGIVVEKSSNPYGCRFYVDDVSYDLARPDSPRLIQSTIPVVYHQDKYLTLNKASTEANALAMIALVARGQSDDIRRARIIGDAFQYCQVNDRYYSDGRLRNAYRTGDIADHVTGKALLTGWWNEDSIVLNGLVVRHAIDSSRWSEDNYQVGTCVGDMAWVITAWLSYDSATGEHRYRDNAVSLGQWIVGNCYDASGVPGFRGGFLGSEPSPSAVAWKSTAHHANLYAAFQRLFAATGDSSWLANVDRAYGFMAAMWDPGSGHFWNGTIDASQVDSLGVLQAQTGPLLATQDTTAYRGSMDWVAGNCAVETLGFKGFHFGTIRDGIWWEGVGQASCALQLRGDSTSAASYVGELRKWQDSAGRGDLKGIVACLPEVIYTGQENYWGSVVCFARLDLSATCWYIFADSRLNPYWDVPTTVTCSRARASADSFHLLVSPTPFGSRMYASYTVSSHSSVSIAVYDAAGRLVRTLASSRLPPGAHRAIWDGADENGRFVPAGVYLCRGTADNAAVERKVVLTR